MPRNESAGNAVVPERPVPATAAERSLGVALLLTTTGGFLDAFTYVGHGKVFANTMTANVVFLGIFVASGQWRAALAIVPTLVAFLLGVWLAYHARHPAFLASIRRPALLCLILEIIFLAIVSVLPRSFPEIILVPGITLVAAIQNTIFTNVESSAYSSVMTTGNLRRFAESLYSGATHQTWVFGALCLCFAFGAAVGALVTHRYHNAALWLPIAGLAGACYLCWEPRERGK